MAIKDCQSQGVLQQCLPLAVLKPGQVLYKSLVGFWVATVLTACGIETAFKNRTNECYNSVATVLTACGIETHRYVHNQEDSSSCNSAYRLRYWNPDSIVKCAKEYKLQQCLPLAVLKRRKSTKNIRIYLLQQCLPLAVLKLSPNSKKNAENFEGCNSAYRLRYWNYDKNLSVTTTELECCNSAYRLRYWNK